jgi:small subunit ribosomal protein S6
MFVVNYNAAKENYEKVEAEVFNCITRFGGEIVNSIKWDERRLTYEIKRQKRGTYILCHFNAEGDAISKIERQAQLCEVVLRALILADQDGPICEVAPTGRDDEYEERNPRKRPAKTEEDAE